MQLTDKLTRYMYMSKVSTFQSCPMRYYWQHHLWLQAKQRPSYFTFGSAFHKVIEIGLKHGFEASELVLEMRQDVLGTLSIQIDEKDLELIKELSETDRKLMLDMLDAFVVKWQSIGVQNILSTEASVKFNVGPGSEYNSRFFDNWVAKADFIFQDLEGHWVGDLKTTSGYGAATATYYHQSPQTKTYFYILQSKMPNLRGTKIFPVTKQKIRCECETILITEQDKDQANLFITEAIQAIDEAEANFQAGKMFHRCMTSCVNSFGQSCPYIPICLTTSMTEAYFNDLVENWYSISSPDEHLELKD